MAESTGAFLLRPRGSKSSQMMSSHEVLTESRVLVWCEPHAHLPPQAQQMLNMALSSFSLINIKNTMDVLANENKKPIKLWITTSSGCDTSESLLLYHAILSWKRKLSIYTIGEEAHNMGLVILAAGTEGHRYVFEDSKLDIFISPISAEELGQVSEEDRILLQERRKIILKLLANHCKETKRRKAELVDIIFTQGLQQHSFTPQEALEWGFADKIITPEIFCEELFGNLDISPPKINTSCSRRGRQRREKCLPLKEEKI